MLSVPDLSGVAPPARAASEDADALATAGAAQTRRERLRDLRHKYGLLATTLLYFLVTANITAYRYVEPFWLFTRRGSTGMWIGLAVLLVVTVFVRNLYCRFLCPVGAALGLLSKLTVFKIKRWSECNTCKICEKTCEWGAIRGPQIVMTECVRCDDCERLYHDTSRCPHWLILAHAKLRGKLSSVKAAVTG